MGIIIVLLPLSVLLGFTGLMAYLWSVRSGQFKDLDTPAMRILLDGEKQASGQIEETSQKAKTDTHAQ
jgi:cbb3-type cytochrome oxidase maturation protein